MRLADAMRSGLVRVEGPTALVRGFPGWLALSEFADVDARRAIDFHEGEELDRPAFEADAGRTGRPGTQR